MQLKDLDEAILLAKRFVTKAEIIRKIATHQVAICDKTKTHIAGGPNAAAVKRASMDLTKALVEIRR